MQRAFAVILVYLLGLIQGIAFTTIPAAANFLTSRQGFGFTDQAYGSIFIPMILGAIAASFAGGAVGKRYSAKNVLLAGMALSALAMAVFALVSILSHARYDLMLLSMLLLGTGFGANITSLNPFAIHFFPNKGSAAVTALHSCLGIGTAIGPLLWVFFRSVGLWWIDPLLIAVTFFTLLIFGIILLPKSAEIPEGEKVVAEHHFLLGVFAFIGFIYGIIETTYGNWSTIYFHQVKNLTDTEANTLLSLFWGAVTGGRIISTFLAVFLPPRWIFRTLPFLIIASAFAIIPISGYNQAIVIMLIAGLGCSAFLPLSVSFGVQNLKTNPTLASGLVIGTYMSGYGVAAEGIGFLHKTQGVAFNSLFLVVAGLAIGLVFLNFVSTWKEKHR